MHCSSNYIYYLCKRAMLQEAHFKPGRCSERHQKIAHNNFLSYHKNLGKTGDTHLYILYILIYNINDVYCLVPLPCSKNYKGCSPKLDI